MTFLFLSSLRWSEILSTDSKKFDPQKTLSGGDLKLVTVQAQGEDMEMIRIKLKQPKTSRLQLTQIVVLPATGGWLCPVMAYKNWQKGRKGGIIGGRPVFTWKEVSLITLEDMNHILGVLLDKEHPKITTRAFRPALPSILARGCRRKC